MNNREVTAADVAHAAKQASFALAASPSKTRNSALLAIAAALVFCNKSIHCSITGFSSRGAPKPSIIFAVSS